MQNESKKLLLLLVLGVIFSKKPKETQVQINFSQL